MHAFGLGAHLGGHFGLEFEPSPGLGAQREEHHDAEQQHGGEAGPPAGGRGDGREGVPAGDAQRTEAQETGDADPGNQEHFNEHQQDAQDKECDYDPPHNIAFYTNTNIQK